MTKNPVYINSGTDLASPGEALSSRTPNGTPTVDQYRGPRRASLAGVEYHPLRPLAALGFTDGGAPFFAGAKLPSRKHSSHFSSPLPSSAPSNARHASSHTPCSSHCFSRRQQVAGEGYLSGKNRHATPVCKIQRMPSRQTRFDAHGRPRLSLRRFARVTAAQSTPTAHRSTTGIASC
jgi:hypothetical protein